MALTARELEENQRARQREQNRQNLEARDDFYASQLKAARNDRGRYSPWEQRAMDEERKTIALRQHEKDMADKQHASDLAIAQEKTRTAGESARQKGLMDIELSKLQDGYMNEDGTFIPGSRMRLEQERIQAGLTQVEKEMEAKMRIAEIEDKGRDRESARRYGYFDPKTGDYVGGSDFNTADVAGEHQAKAEQARATASLAIAGLNASTRKDIANGNNASREKIANGVAALTDEKARRRLTTDILRGQYAAAGLTADAWQKMTREQQDEKIRQLFGVPAAGAAGTGQGAAQGAGGWRGALNW